MRYRQLVKEHLQVSELLAAGWRALPDTNNSFASTPAAERFYQNEPTSWLTLMQPWLAEAAQGVVERCSRYTLSLADWSMVNFSKPQSQVNR